MVKRPPSSAAKRMREYRARMRAKGMRQVQIWTWDTRRPGFAEEIRRQSLNASRSAAERDIRGFTDATWEDLDDECP